ncbi:VCBS domain-containing protein [Aeromonas hydrophila]|uniref:VCBS domain-containing protein n=1 Tax=Aeromonas hydrophila TaxID=644 RepID=UPI0039E4B67E
MAGSEERAFGRFEVGTDGKWSFVLANNATVDALTAGEKHIEQFTVTSERWLDHPRSPSPSPAPTMPRLSRPTPARSPREIKPRSPAP